tara:strand:+ start:780 stop:968 length:189 start_codon:yes stop_codon:yes gene_type:complete
MKILLQGLVESIPKKGTFVNTNDLNETVVYMGRFVKGCTCFQNWLFICTNLACERGYKATQV